MNRIRCLILLSAVLVGTVASLSAGVFLSVAIGPPALPVYAQPIAPGPGYIWTPGYWAWGPDGYFWVPGTWALAPAPGLLWTPGYWAFSTGLYCWHPGYWGPRVGFYGGINYGFGYPGIGYYGGYWRGRDFYYNRAVNNVNINNVHNVYNQTIVNNVNLNRVSYNGGPQGIQARPTAAELAAERQQHVAATAAQVRHQQMARNERAQLAAVNHGRPTVAATPRPGALNGREAAWTNQPSVNRPAPNMARNSVPRPPQSNPQARASENVPRPLPSSHATQRASLGVPRPPSTRQQSSVDRDVQRLGSNAHQAVVRTQPHPNNVPRPALRQARPEQYSSHQAAFPSHAAPRPAAPHVAQRAPSPHPGGQPRQAAARQSPSGGGREQHRSR
jgi:hypothetical protein